MSQLKRCRRIVPLILAALLVAADSGGGASGHATGADSRFGRFYWPMRVYMDAAGRIYVADWGNNRIVRMNDMTGAGWATRH